MRMCICKCFLHSCCNHRVLRNIWFNICVILHDRWMSNWIPRLCRSHEGMRNHVQPIDVAAHCPGTTQIWPIGARYSEKCIHLLSIYSKHNLEPGEYGGIVWTYLNCRTTLSGQCMTTIGPHRICSENKETSSNSLTSWWSS